MTDNVPVLYLMDHANLGGVQTCLVNLLKATGDPQVEPHIAALYGPGPMSARFEAIGHPLINLGEHKKDSAIPRALRRVIREKGIRIVHAYGVPSCALCEILRGWLGIEELVVHVQSTYRTHHSRPWQNLVEPLLYRRADTLVACSQTVLNPIHRAIPSKVIYNGVDYESLQVAPPEETRRSLRAEFGISPGDFLIGTTGRIFPGKDPLTLCRAAKRLAGEGKNAKVLFLGTGPMADEVRDFAKVAGLSDRIILAGYQSNVKDWLYTLDAFAFPTLHEGLPMALMEAMAVGLPCVVSDFPSATEVVTPGRDALQFKRGDDAELAKLLSRVMDDEVLRQQLGEAGREKVRANFTATTMANECATLYKNLLGG